MGSFNTYEWLQIIMLGGLLGAMGQGARVIVGLKKLNDAASGQSASGDAISATDLISGSRMGVSLAIGFIAGALAAITTFHAAPELLSISGQKIAALAAAGYAGADFIEGFMQRSAPAQGNSAGTSSVSTGSAGGAGDDAGSAHDGQDAAG